ncbi:MAG: ATP-dependent nuclease, partial [Promethearchaeota archaeon]
RCFSMYHLGINGNIRNISGDRWALKNFPQVYHYLQNIILLDDYLARKLKSLETGVFGPLLEPRLDKKIVEYLNKIYGIKAEGLTFLPVSPTLPQTNTFRLATMLPEQSLHIDELGDGAKYAVALLSTALLLENSALLIEEIESHQHIGAIKKLLPTLLEIAEERGLQLFITTHSYEIIQAFSQLSEKYDVKFFHLVKNADGSVSIREIPGPDIKLLSDLGVDIRELEVYKRFFIVEGVEDVNFLKAIFQKYDKKVEDAGDLIPAGDKKQVKNVAVALTATGKEIVAFIDYDKDSEEKILESFKNNLNGHNIKFTPEENSFKINSSGSVIIVIPLGLPKDETLRKLGITHHEMEDYCLKLMEIDENVVKRLGISLNEIVDSAKKAKFEKLNKSKAYIRILASKKDMDYSEIIRSIIMYARKENIDSIIGKIKTIISSI